MIQLRSYSANSNLNKKYDNLAYFGRVGERLRELREDRGINQKDFAKLLGGYTQSSISRKEQGEREISSSEIARFAQVLKLSSNEILYLVLGVRSE